jgi:hypothetical protein
MNLCYLNLEKNAEDGVLGKQKKARFNFEASLLNW